MDDLEHPDIKGSIILRWNYRELEWVAWTGLIWLRIRTVDGHL
jgi:hypothetical protein